MAAIIAGYARMPFTAAHEGALTGISPYNLAAIAIPEPVRRCTRCAGGGQGIATIVEAA